MQGLLEAVTRCGSQSVLMSNAALGPCCLKLCLVVAACCVELGVQHLSERSKWVLGVKVLTFVVGCRSDCGHPAIGLRSGSYSSAALDGLESRATVALLLPQVTSCERGCRVPGVMACYSWHTAVQGVHQTRHGFRTEQLWWIAAVTEACHGLEG